MALTILISFFWVTLPHELADKRAEDALKMETACFSEMLAPTNQSTQ